MNNQTYQNCIQACLDCLRVCEVCADCCIGNAPQMADRLRLCLDCAESCQNCARAMARNSPYMPNGVPFVPKGLLAGKPSGESQASFKKWLSQRSLV